MRPGGKAESLQERRERAIRIIKDGYASDEVAKMVGVTTRSVQRWKLSYRKKGKSGIAARPVPGRPIKST